MAITLDAYDDYVVGPAVVVSSAVGDLAIEAGGGNTMHILGAAIGYTYGIRSIGPANLSGPFFYTETFVGPAGYLYGRTAAYSLVAGGDSIVNQGTISGKATAIATEIGYAGTYQTLVNSGVILAGTHARSDGINAAIYLKGMAKQATLTDNSGTISAQLAGSFALRFDGNTNDKVVNSGQIIGKVSLGGGNDYLDTIIGTVKGKIDLGDGADTVVGSAGNDTIYGGTGDDRIIGNTGNDIIEGGTGRDTMTGNSGADQFLFRFVNHSGKTNATADIVTDFKSADKDKIHLKEIDASSVLANDQAFKFIGTAGFTTNNTGEVRYSVSGGKAYVAGDINGDKAADFVIELTGVTTLTAADFVL